MDLRCFIAIEIPDEIKREMHAIIDILRTTGADVKWIPAENLHLTLKFLGKTPESVIIPITEVLGKKMLSYSPFYITISHVGCFPDRRRPRILWIGADQAEVMKEMHGDIENEMRQFGFSAESRAFHAHVTIGRVRSLNRVRPVIRKLDEYASHNFGTCEVRNISLIKSELSPAGARYKTLAQIPLGRRNNVE
jgi:2'-5' RNA ligase